MSTRLRDNRGPRVNKEILTALGLLDAPLIDAGATRDVAWLHRWIAGHVLKEVLA